MMVSIQLLDSMPYGISSSNFNPSESYIRLIDQTTRDHWQKKKIHQVVYLKYCPPKTPSWHRQQQPATKKKKKKFGHICVHNGVRMIYVNGYGIRLKFHELSPCNQTRCHSQHTLPILEKLSQSLFSRKTCRVVFSHRRIFHFSQLFLSLVPSTIIRFNFSPSFIHIQLTFTLSCEKFHRIGIQIVSTRQMPRTKTVALNY